MDDDEENKQEVLVDPTRKALKRTDKKKRIKEDLEKEKRKLKEEGLYPHFRISSYIFSNPHNSDDDIHSSITQGKYNCREANIPNLLFPNNIEWRIYRYG